MDEELFYTIYLFVHSSIFAKQQFLPWFMEYACGFVTRGNSENFIELRGKLSKFLRTLTINLQLI